MLLDVALVVPVLGLHLAQKLVAAALVDKVCAPAQLAHEAVRLLVQLARRLARAADDERRARLVDQDGVHLVDDGVDQPALHHLLAVDNHVVAQVVKAELVVRAVGDVARVGRPPLVAGQPVYDAAHVEPEKPVDLPHPLRIAPGQIVVDGDDVHALAPERVEIRRERRHERLALAGLHLRDAALVQHHAAEQLHVEMPHLHGAHGRLAHRGERLAHQVVHRFAVLQPLAEARRLRAQLGIAHGLHRGFQCIDALHIWAQLLETALARIAKQGVDQSHCLLLICISS